MGTAFEFSKIVSLHVKNLNQNFMKKIVVVVGVVVGSAVVVVEVVEVVDVVVVDVVVVDVVVVVGVVKLKNT